MNPQYDSVLISILQNEGGIDKFIDVIFGFLTRRTDFFYERQEGSNLGMPPDFARKMMMRSFNKYQMCFRQYQEKYLKPTDETKAKSPVREPNGDEVDTAAKVVKEPVATPAAAKGDSKPRPPRNQLPGTGTYFKKDEKGERFYEAEPDCYNGARREQYSWSQQILELDIYVKIPQKIKSGNDLVVRLEKKHVFISEKGSAEPIIDLNLFREVRTDTATWSFEPDDNVVHISLDKIEDLWWEAAFEGEEHIDVQNIDASRPMEELDHETQAKIAQMLFDQEQKRKGLPTSEDKKIQDILASAWNKEGSPFAGQPFDPSKVSIASGSQIPQPPLD